MALHGAVTKRVAYEDEQLGNVLEKGDRVEIFWQNDTKMATVVDECGYAQNQVKIAFDDQKLQSFWMHKDDNRYLKRIVAKFQPNMDW